MGRLYSNNFSTTITTTSLGSGDVSVDISSTTGLPLIGGGDYCLLTLTDSLTAPTKTEIIKAVSLATNTLSIERAQEGTTAQSWASGDIIELRATAESFEIIDGTTIARYKELVNASAGTTIDRADGGIQTVTMSQNDSYTIVMDNAESMTVQYINTDVYVPAWTNVTWPNGITPTFTGSIVFVTFLKVNNVVYGFYSGNYA